MRHTGRFLSVHRILVLVVVAACGGSSSKHTAATPPTESPPARPQPPGRVPCFSERTAPLEATAMYEELQKYAMSWMMPDDEKPPPATYGSCTVADSKITAADGTLVAELTCGVRILVPGIEDDLGFELGTGARGQDVLDRKPGHPPLTCWANGPTQSRCRFDRPDDSDTDSSAYVVDGSFPGDALTGADAVAFFAPRELVELDVSIWCH
jgi:hypothetical protein